MLAVNDIVTLYDLPYQAKDTLKSSDLTLFDTYNAQEIVDEHSLRLVNRLQHSTTPTSVNTASSGRSHNPVVERTSGFHSGLTLSKNRSGLTG